MTFKALLRASAAFSALAICAMTSVAARAEDDKIETVTVTGSRVIADAARSPTPLTTISAQQLQATTPTNIPDGLNKLPIFQGSVQIRRAGDGTGGFGVAGVQGGNLPSNVLNLRNFGSQRTLVLLDGHRAPPANSDGTVDIDTLPQMLISRVDIVTGGASAVYGSDAVTGVVNFILDKKFDGLKAEANSGISDFGDAASFKVDLAAGTDLFGGRAHLEGSIEYRHEDGFLGFSRPYGPGLAAQVGSGTAANPFAFIPNGRRPNSSFGGRIQGCKPACAAANGMQFVSDGVLGPFNPGTPGAHDANGNPTVGTGNENSGGDGAYSPYTTAQATYRQGSVFSRLSYDLDSTTDVYVQVAGSESYSYGFHFPQKLTPGANQADIFYKNNPFLTPAVQTALGNNGTNPIMNPGSPATAPNNTFQLGEFLVSFGQSELNINTDVNRLLNVQAGVDGTLMDGRFSWNLFYTHGENRLADDLMNNQNFQKLYAAEDAVIGAGGTIQCYAATQAATAAAYASCVPLNPFGPTAVTRQAVSYFSETTNFRQTNVLDNVGGAISGRVFDDWAGPVQGALSAEARFEDYTVTTNVPPNQTVDCTGLRLCFLGLPKYAQGVLVPIHASDNVWEVAGEAEVPLLKDLPLVQSFDANIAGRYTNYSVSGAVQTWKVGLVYNVIDALRLRGTTSVDIRAPRLNDLFQPAVLAVIGFSDIHTNTNSTTFSVTQGNPNLVPEVSRTYTVGAVLSPDFISGLILSLDYFQIHMKNAITTINPQSTAIQGLCESSGGTSPFCALYQRPNPFSDHTSANYPTRIFTEELNTAALQTEGFDFEANYAFDMADLDKDWAGSWTARALASYQPVLKSIQFPGAAFTRTTSPHTRVTAFLNYALDKWTFGLQDRWLSGFSQVAGPVTPTSNNWVNPYVHSYNLLDVNIERGFEAWGADMQAYFVVQNLLNAQPALVPSVTNVGLNYPVAPGQDIVGRYYTIGIRAQLQ